MKSSTLGRQGRALLMAAAVALLLSACGGGGGQVEKFSPTRIISFGDESSVITPDGRKYTVNGVNPLTNVQTCTENPIWVQTLARQFGLVFPQCNVDGFATPSGQMLASAGARVSDVATKVDQYFSTNSFTSRDLVTVMAGANDVIELYNAFPQQSMDSLVAEARGRGRVLGQLVNRIATAGGRVIVSTLPDMGVTPFAIKEKSSKFDTDRAAFLSKLSDEFNIAMRLALINDGRMIGLVLLDEAIQQRSRFPGYDGFTNVADGACLSTIGILSCTGNTLALGASADTWLWANDFLLSPGGHRVLGSLAATRAVNNPF